MNKEEDRIKEYIFQAVQATKQENSGLIAELKKSVESIREEQKKVAEELKDYVRLDTVWKEADKEWKDNATPSINIMKKIQGSSSVIRWVVQTIILLGILVGTVTGLIKLFK